jgi:ElaB/YqjD/DUF883 family membrane-anchored ribosome-binding protein
MLDTIRANAMPPAPTSTPKSQPGRRLADVKALVKDAQSLLTAAAALTGNKADELRERGMQMLDRAGQGRPVPGSSRRQGQGTGAHGRCLC